MSTNGEDSNGPVRPPDMHQAKSDPAQVGSRSSQDTTASPLRHSDESKSSPALNRLSSIPSAAAFINSANSAGGGGAMYEKLRAGMQKIQKSRPQRSNSGSGPALPSFNPAALSSGASQPGSPGITETLSQVNLSRSSSGSGGSSYSAPSYGNSSTTSPVILPVNDDVHDSHTDTHAPHTNASPAISIASMPVSSSSSPATAGSPSYASSFSGPLFVNPSPDTIAAPKTSFMERRNKPKLSLSGNMTGRTIEANGVGASGSLSAPIIPTVVPSASSLARASPNGPGPKRANRPNLALANISETRQLETKPDEGIFSKYKKYVDVKTGSLNFAGKASLHSKGIDFSSGSSFRISLDEFELLGELGRGNYGTVTKVLHKPTNVVMAMKEIRLELDEAKFTQIIMELDILHKCVSPYIVDFYGAFFAEGAVYVCMEYMDGGSLDKIYKNGVDEPYLAVITDAVVRGLMQLKDEHNIIHRDVKPTNILISTSGKVKLCDFGVSGNLVASIARTNIGCQSYMAPERIRSTNPADAITYTVQSDIWSLGLSILEIAKGSYPYPPETYDNIFSQLSAIVDGDPPRLDEARYSEAARSFVDACLNKAPKMRPSYAKLLQHPWLKKYDPKAVDLAEFVIQAKQHKDEADPVLRPALHDGRRGLE